MCYCCILCVCCCSVLENYAKWQLIRSYIPYLSDDFINVYYAFTKTTQGTEHTHTQPHSAAPQYNTQLATHTSAHTYTHSAAPHSHFVTMCCSVVHCTLRCSFSELPVSMILIIFDPIIFLHLV